MKENNLEELIDGFLRNKLNAADQARLQKIIESDPQADTLLKESQETYRYILHLRYNKIRNQLRHHDQFESLHHRPSRIKRLLIAASLLLLVVLASYLVAGYTFSPCYVAKRNFETIPAVGLSPAVSGYVMAAEDFFNHENFQSAARLYQPVVELMDDNYVQHAKWNYLMCQLVVEGPTQQWKKDMLIFIAEADDHFKMKGHKVLRLYNAAFYQLYSGISTRNFSPVKPRLI